MRPVRWNVPLSDIAVDEILLATVADAVASGWWSMGPRVEELELRFARRLDVKHAVAVANGTAALELALLACGCGPGDEVVLPSLNFVAAANAISHTGATPVFCDISGLDDLNLDVADVEAALTPRTKAIVALHYGGWPCRVNALAALAHRHGLALVEDAAHAPGASRLGRACGTFGLAGCFSFFANKNLATGEGGMIVTNDDALAAELRLLRSHGMTTLTWDRHRGHASAYDVVRRGYNLRLDEIRAGLGVVQLERLDEANAARRALLALYRERIDGVAGITMPFRGSDADSACHLAVAVLPDDVPRDETRSALTARGVQTSVHYPPIHLFSAYADADSHRRSLPHTEEAASRILTLPLYPTLTREQLDYVAQALLETISHPAAA